MLPGRLCLRSLSPSRRYSSPTAPRSVPVLPDDSILTFQREAFVPATPAIFPRKAFATIPAISRWFHVTGLDSNPKIELNVSYMSPFGAAIVPIELTGADSFARSDQPLSFFLKALSISAPTTNVYLAQASLEDLPQGMRSDLLTPEVITKAGRGDIYGSSLWLGLAPTYTPLHRDPNPNLFVQLAGTKVVRLLKPSAGQAIFAETQEILGTSASATIRGEEMMRGAEKRLLADAVWGNNEKQVNENMWQAELESGDALFIPKGWWHSVKGIGDGIIGSVNWWFR